MYNYKIIFLKIISYLESKNDMKIKWKQNENLKNNIKYNEK